MPLYEVSKAMPKGGAEALLSISMPNPTDEQDTAIAKTCLGFIDSLMETTFVGRVMFYRNTELIRSENIGVDPND